MPSNNFDQKFQSWHLAAVVQKQLRESERARMRANWSRLQRANKQAALAKQQREQRERDSMLANWLRLEKEEARRVNSRKQLTRTATATRWLRRQRR